jgi:hypothetical protein
MYLHTLHTRTHTHLAPQHAARLVGVLTSNVLSFVWGCSRSDQSLSVVWRDVQWQNRTHVVSEAKYKIPIHSFSNSDKGPRAVCVCVCVCVCVRARR